ncbi:EAL domain-containing protein [Azospirillum doebereinerae]|uniref:EAL domain-containing protein n=1 Tax=Azospirillum doebereinerae TaxID=92933 RepID=A0A3S0V5K4_9PROT|nr:EAL domain-containing protein [Azospirillum doebereinerae]RUQ69318.1 EAL domain-containing protein [Azospirillum doebereinerae]
MSTGKNPGRHPAIPATLRHDRFVAFAFASAHLLLETDDDGRIAFAAGARCGLTDRTTEDLVGQSLFDLLPAEEHAFIRMLLARLIEGGKLDLTHVVMRTVAGQRSAMMMGGCRLPNHPNRCFLGFTIASGLTERMAGRCLPELKIFVESLERRLSVAGVAEHDQRLSLLAVEGLAGMPASDAIRGDVEAYLLSVSSNGDAAVRLNDERYAVLHNADLTREEIASDIGRLLVRHGADDLCDALHVWQLPVQGGDMPLSDVARALSYTLQTFAAGRPGALGIADVNSAVVDMLQSTIGRVGQVRRILEQRDFHLAYQPIVNLVTGKLHHVEALMRVGDSASPAEFIAFAERVGLICDLDLLVLQTALDALKAAHDQKRAIPDIAINLSAVTLNSPLMVEQLQTVLRPYGIIARKLLIEVTETAAVHDFRGLNQTLDRLRRMGLRVCLDDVGSGTTSFLSLNELRVDYAKLDGRIVRGALTNSRDRAILHSIVEIARHINIELIAEQVETDAQLHHLRQLGVRYGQGYLFGKPSASLSNLDQGMPSRPARRTGKQVSWE